LLYIGFEDAILFAQSDGEKLFKQICIACHTIGQGKLIGPDLANVHKRQSEEWIIRFIKSSQSVIKSGDPYATALYHFTKNINAW
jgi:cytochrome c2